MVNDSKYSGTGYLPGPTSAKMIPYSAKDFTRYTSSQIFTPRTSNVNFISSGPNIGMILSELLNHKK